MRSFYTLIFFVFIANNSIAKPNLIFLKCNYIEHMFAPIGFKIRPDIKRVDKDLEIFQMTGDDYYVLDDVKEEIYFEDTLCFSKKDEVDCKPRPLNSKKLKNKSPFNLYNKNIIKFSPIDLSASLNDLLNNSFKPQKLGIETTDKLSSSLLFISRVTGDYKVNYNYERIKIIRKGKCKKIDNKPKF